MTNAQQSGGNGRSTGELLKDLTGQVSHLVRDEIRLATAELEAKGKRFGFGAGLFGVAGLFGAYAGAAFVAAVILLLAQVLPAWAAALVVATVVGVVAVVLALVARDQVRRATPPVPEQAVGSVRQDIEVVRESARR